MRRALVGLALLLAGCSAYSVQPLTSPPPQEVVNYADELAGVVKPDMTPREYLAASIVYSDQKCEEFFNALSRFKQDSSMFEKVLSAALTAGTPLYPIFGVKQAAQTVFSTTLATTQSLTNSYAEIYAFTPYAEELRRLVKDAQQTYIDGPRVKAMVSVINLYSPTNPVTTVDPSGSVTVAGNSFVASSVTRREAYLASRMVANGYASQCSLANLHSLIRQSIQTAKVAVPADPNPAPKTGTPAKKGRSAFAPIPPGGEVSSSSVQPRVVP